MRVSKQAIGEVIFVLVVVLMMFWHKNAHAENGMVILADEIIYHEDMSTVDTSFRWKHIVASEPLPESAKLEILYRDYELTDDVTLPVSVGLATWKSPDWDTQLAAYWQVAYMTYGPVRFGMGIIGIYPDKLRVKPLTSLCTPVGERWEIGVYYTPFWGLDDRFDDPYGVMVGYRL